MIGFCYSKDEMEIAVDMMAYDWLLLVKGWTRAHKRYDGLLFAVAFLCS